MTQVLKRLNDPYLEQIKTLSAQLPTSMQGTMERKHTPEQLRALTGISQSDYDAWRRALKGAPPPRVNFTNGDVLAYRVVNFFVHEAGVELRVLKHLETELIFNACKHHFGELRHWRIIYNLETTELALLHNDQPNPEVKYSIRIREVPLSTLIDEHIASLQKLMPSVDANGSKRDEKSLSELAEQFNKRAHLSSVA